MGSEGGQARASRRLEDAGAVVTGAGHGIGKELATRLVDKGARVVVNDLDVDACHAVAEQLGAVAVPGDCAAEAGVRGLLAAARAALGRIDIYVANAGMDRLRPDSLQAPEEDWSQIFDVNVMAHVRAARLLVPGWLGDGQRAGTANGAGSSSQRPRPDCSRRSAPRRTR